MQKVFTNEMTAHVWAQQSQDQGRNSNDTLYFYGATIFSYGSHFPIARFVRHSGTGDQYRQPAVLFTTADYSVTTSAHKSLVWRAIPSFCTVFDVADVTANTPEKHRENLSDYLDRVNGLIESAAKRRKSDLADSDLEAADRLAAEARDYAEFFKVAAKRILKKFPDISNASDMAELRARLKEKAEKEKAAKDKKPKKKDV